MKALNLRGLLGKALVLVFFSLSFTALQAQTAKEAVDIIDTELASIELYLQDKYPQYPDVKASELDQGDWYRINHISALTRLKGGLLDPIELELTEEVAIASKQGFPTSAYENGLIYLREDDQSGTENHDYLEQYLSGILGL